jgi:hypothetical protein
MGRSIVIAMLLLVILGLANLSNSYEKPFKMGQGRFLNQKEMKTFFHDIENSQPWTFKKSFSETLGNLLVSLFEYSNSDTAKFQVIEFNKFVIKVSGLEKSKGHGPYYMLCINCNEGIPNAELTRRQKTKRKYYDIWVLSGPYILIERDSKTGEYRLLSSGFAE